MSTPLVFTLCSIAATCTIPFAPSSRLQQRSLEWQATIKRLAGHPTVIITVIMVVVVLNFRHLIGVLMPSGFALGMAAATAMYLLQQLRLRRRNAWQCRDMSQALGITIGELQAGAQVGQALRTASEQITEPQLKQAITMQALNHPPYAEENIPALQLLAAGLRIADDTGMSLLGVLRHIRDRLDSEQRHQARTTAALGGAKITAIILAILPIFGMLMGVALGINTLAILFGTGLGNLLLIAGIGAECMGLIWSNHIIEKAAQ